MTPSTLSSETQLSLRPVLPEDVEALYCLDRLCFSTDFCFNRATMRRFALQPNAITMRAEEQHRLLGFVLAHREPGWLYIVTLDVHPEARRRGLASQLLQALETHCSREKIPATCLHVWTENAGALHFYEKQGFSEVGFEQNFYGAGRHALMLTKPVPLAVPLSH